MERVERRTFIKLALATTALLSGIELVKGKEITKKASEAKEEKLWGLVIDLRKCVRCGRCVTACKEKNKLPEHVFFNKMMKVRISGREYELPASCMHCRRPPCMYVCPTGATYRREDGIVLVDYDICIGCRYCVAACPYLARVPNEEELPLFPKGVVIKCNFCVDLIDAGKVPACVAACPYGARIFGNLKDPTSEVFHVLESSKSVVVLKPELGTWPTWYYILG